LADSATGSVAAQRTGPATLLRTDLAATEQGVATAAEEVVVIQGLGHQGGQEDRLLSLKEGSGLGPRGRFPEVTYHLRAAQFQQAAVRILG